MLVTVVELQRVVQIDLVERPFVLEPHLRILHVDAVVISEMTAVSLHDRVVVIGDLVLAHVDDVFLRETAAGCQLLDVAVCERIDINPLVTA